MFDDFKSEKNEKDIDILSSSSPLPLNKKLALGIAALAVLSFFVWYSMDATPSQMSPTKNSSQDYAVLQSRIEALEQAVFARSQDNAFPYTASKAASDTSSLFNDAIVLDPQEPSSQQEEHIQIDSIEVKPVAPPKEIALELSSLFEKEIALSSNTSSQQASKPAPRPAAAASVAQSKPQAQEMRAPQQRQKKTYTVQRGDTLSKISQKFYGTSRKWKKIADANRDVLGQSQILKVGMVLTIPEN